MTEMNCNECDVPVEATNWIMLSVKNGHEVTTGFLCSTNCLIDYAAHVGALDAGIGVDDDGSSLSSSAHRTSDRTSEDSTPPLHMDPTLPNSRHCPCDECQGVEVGEDSTP